MPRTQTANTGVYDFGAPVTEGVPLRFKARQGGRLTVRMENYGDSTLTCTLQVSADGTSYADTTVAANGDAVADEAIPARQFREFQIFLRQGQDNYMRLQAVGGVRGQLQIRGDEALIVDLV
jgi:transposase-like protein